MSWWTVARRELGSAFTSPLAYVLMALYLLLSGYFFVAIVLQSQTTDMSPMLQNVAVVLLFLAPLFTMRLLAEERRLGTDELILTSPITPGQWVFGKFVGALGEWTVFIAVTLLYPLALSRMGNVAWPATFAGYFGLWLLGATLLAAGVFASSLTDNQVVAAMVAFAIALLFWAASWVSSSVTTTWVQNFLNYISAPSQFSPLASGVLNTSNLVYFISITAGFLFLAVRVIDARRWA
jgi:ABC-2 type transport system permease protein